ncbi:divalent cation tolerance protein CutA [Nocardia colli]|uniref:divalent cation tolerance protein CutA n=1 Tax=Nocardia colli TaxID=2545717 RepID=UPI0035DC0D5E
MMLVIATIHQRSDAERIGRELLTARKIAGYNLISTDSAFWWEGDILAQPETIMLLRVPDHGYATVEATVIELSGYDVPDIFSVQPNIVNELFNRWVNSEATG